jgi:hypothetical protein
MRLLICLAVLGWSHVSMAAGDAVQSFRFVYSINDGPSIELAGSRVHGNGNDKLLATVQVTSVAEAFALHCLLKSHEVNYVSSLGMVLSVPALTPVGAGHKPLALSDRRGGASDTYNAVKAYQVVYAADGAHVSIPLDVANVPSWDHNMSSEQDAVAWSEILQTHMLQYENGDEPMLQSYPVGVVSEYLKTPNQTGSLAHYADQANDVIHGYSLQEMGGTASVQLCNYDEDPNGIMMTGVMCQYMGGNAKLSVDTGASLNALLEVITYNTVRFNHMGHGWLFINGWNPKITGMKLSAEE